MSELGIFLRQVREAKNISLDKIQEVTKIRKRYLEAIEVGEYSVLPGQFYARAFIKSYADAIGLNADDVLEQYASELPHVQKVPVETLARRKNKEVKTTSPKLGKWISRLVLYAFIVLVIFVIWLAAAQYIDIPQENQTLEPTNPGVSGEGLKEPSTPNGQNQGGEASPEPTTEPEANIKPDESPDEVEEPIVNAEWKRLETSGDNTIFELSNADRMEITLLAEAGDVWYNLRDQKDKRTIDTETLKRGNDKVWDLSAFSEIRLRLGNTRNATVIVNGEQIDISDLPNTHNLIIRFNPVSNE